jgi:DNA-binding transcriptional ArsR family regulator
MGELLNGCDVLTPMDAAPVQETAPEPRRRGRFVALNKLVDCTLAELSRAEIAVWLVLYRDTRDGSALASYDWIAPRAGVDRRNVGRALRRLQARGLVRVLRRGGLGRGASRYRVRGVPKGG